MLYNSIVYPHILYRIILWGSTYTSHHKKLQLLQKKAVRAICSLYWRVHATPCFDRLSILKVRDVAEMEMTKFVHKSVHLSSDNLAIPLFRTSRAQRSIKYQGSKVWNSIPTTIQRLKLKKFTQTYREQILVAYKH